MRGTKRVVFGGVETSSTMGSYTEMASITWINRSRDEYGGVKTQAMLIASDVFACDQQASKPLLIVAANDE